uniref:Uncharacterized protein n=1 Tax=Arundo donax TaxID=35708 RepID=A0A0A9F1S6_ARUDO
MRLSASGSGDGGGSLAVPGSRPLGFSNSSRNFSVVDRLLADGALGATSAAAAPIASSSSPPYAAE